MTDGMSIWDAQARRSRLCSRMCATCVFQPGNRMSLRPGRLRDLVTSARARTPDGLDGSYITCHETLPYAGTGTDPAVCRGFFDRYSTQTLQVIERLWGFIEVDPPDHIGGTMGPTTGPPDERMYATSEACEYLGIHENTLKRWDADGKLPAIRLPSRPGVPGHRRWRQFDLEAVRAGRPLPTRDGTGRVVPESTVRPSETAVTGRTAPGGD